MAHHHPDEHRDDDHDAPSKAAYKKRLRELQIELVKLQRYLIAENLKILVLLEGRDAAGKDGVIKRLTAHLSPRETRIVALGRPSDRDRSEWYFQRHVAHLPAAQEMVVMNRSWYNRAGVERVMGFCTDAEYEEFMRTVLPFEHMLIDSGIRLHKYYLDISKDEQKRRLADRRHDPLKQWKVSPIDQVAVKHWEDYSKARNEMFLRTHNGMAPWMIVKADDKRTARLALISHLLSEIDYPKKDAALCCPDPELVFPFQQHHLEDGSIAP